MQKQFVRPLFYNDGHATRLLEHGSGRRYANVYENSLEDQFFGAACATRAGVVKETPILRGTRPLYRIVVKAKPYGNRG